MNNVILVSSDDEESTDVEVLSITTTEEEAEETPKPFKTMNTSMKQLPTGTVTPLKNLILESPVNTNTNSKNSRIKKDECIRYVQLLLPSDLLLEGLVERGIDCRIDESSTNSRIIRIQRTTDSTNTVTIEHKLFLLVELSELVNVITTESVDNWMSEYINCIVLLSGYDLYVKKYKSQQHKHFIHTMGNSVTTNNMIDPSVIEIVLTKLQFSRKWYINYTRNTQQTLHLLTTFTREIAYEPYRQTLHNITSNRATGIDTTDTYIKLLQHIPMLTSTTAHSIVSVYPTFTQLLNVLLECGSTVLENINIVNQSTGQVRRLGPVLSSRIHRILTFTPSTFNNKIST